MSCGGGLDAIKRNDDGMVIATVENLHQRSHRHAVSGGFLTGIADSMERNTLLAWHESHCKRIKYDVFMAGYKKAEKLQQEEQTFTNVLNPQLYQITSSAGVSGSSSPIIIETDATSQQSTTPITCSSPSASSTPSMTRSSSPSASSSTSKKRKYSGSAVATSSASITSLHEPYVLRMSVYQKLAIHLQHFYNDQDILSIESLILYPLCTPSVVKTLYFWESTQSGSLSVPSDVNKNNQKLNKLLLHTITFQGSQGISDACAHIFETLPDNVIVYHPTNIYVQDEDCEDVATTTGLSSPSSNAHRGIIVKVPYSYFFQMPMNGLPSSSSSSNTSTNLIDVELQGCAELTFSNDSNHSIAHIHDHVTLAKSSTGTLTMKQVMQYMGYP
jgi:hypothetical protein